MRRALAQLGDERLHPLARGARTRLRSVSICELERDHRVGATVYPPNYAGGDGRPPASPRPDPRGRAPRRLPERARARPDRGQAPPDRAARALGPAADRGDLARPGRGRPAARRRRGGARLPRAPAGRRGGRARAERARARPRPRLQGQAAPGERVRLRLGDTQPAERQPLRRRVAGRARAGDRRGAIGGTARRRGDQRQLRLPLRGPRPARAGVRDRRPARRRRRRGDRVRRHDRDGQPSLGRRLLRRRPARRSAPSWS